MVDSEARVKDLIRKFEYAATIVESMDEDKQEEFKRKNSLVDVINKVDMDLARPKAVRDTKKDGRMGRKGSKTKSGTKYEGKKGTVGRAQSLKKNDNNNDRTNNKNNNRNNKTIDNCSIDNCSIENCSIEVTEFSTLDPALLRKMSRKNSITGTIRSMFTSRMSTRSAARHKRGDVRDLNFSGTFPSSDSVILGPHNVRTVTEYC